MFCKKKKHKSKPVIPTNYCDYIHSSYWKKLSKSIINERGRCFVCGSIDKLTVHHSKYQKRGKEKRKDLIVACWRCHQEIHNLVLNDPTIKLKNAHGTYKSLFELRLDLEG